MVAAASSSVPKRPIGQWTSRSSKCSGIALEHCTLCRRSIGPTPVYAYAGTGQVNVKVAAELDHSGFSRRIPDLGRGCADVGGEKGGCVDHRTAGRLGALCQSDVVVDNVEPAESNPNDPR